MFPFQLCLPLNPNRPSSGQYFLSIFTLGKWSFMLSYPAAHLIKGKHIYHLIKLVYCHLKMVFEVAILAKFLVWDIPRGDIGASYRDSNLSGSK